MSMCEAAGHERLAVFPSKLDSWCQNGFIVVSGQRRVYRAMSNLPTQVRNPLSPLNTGDMVNREVP